MDEKTAGCVMEYDMRLKDALKYVMRLEDAFAWVFFKGL